MAQEASLQGWSTAKYKCLQQGSRCDERAEIMATMRGMPNLLQLSRKETISQFHTLRKQLASVERDPSLPTEVAREARRAVLRAQLQLIGMEQYQAASREGEALGGGFDSSRWVLQVLRDDSAGGCGGERGEDERLCVAHDGRVRLLDVGAIVHRFPTEFVSASGDHIALDATSIDLHPADPAPDDDTPRVLRTDLVDYARASGALCSNTAISSSHVYGSGPPSFAHFDAVSLALCVNFEGCARRRGLMLYAAARLLRVGGALFLVLPRPCIDNSRYCDELVVRRVFDALGMRLATVERTNGLFKCIATRMTDRVDVMGQPWTALRKKCVLRNGTQRNNFAICLDAELVQRSANGPKLRMGFGEREGHTKNEQPSIRFSARKQGAKKRPKSSQMSHNVKRTQGVQKKPVSSNQRRRARRKAKQMQKLNFKT